MSITFDYTISKITVNGLEASSITKPGGTGDEILLGDGTTTSLAALSTVFSIEELEDVNVVGAPQNGQVLVYNGNNSQWELGNNGPSLFLQATEPTNWSVGDFWIKT